MKKKNTSILYIKRKARKHVGVNVRVTDTTIVILTARPKREIVERNISQIKRVMISNVISSHFLLRIQIVRKKIDFQYSHIFLTKYNTEEITISLS